jgi:hypothetical protein
MKTNNRMKDAIRLRLESDSWDSRIASGVLAEITGRRERRLLRGSFVSIAAASFSVIFFILNLYFTGITSGSSETLYGYTYSMEELSSGSYDITAEISGLINEAYPMR